MKFDALLALVGNQPLFETGLLLAGDVDPAHVQRQLSRWVRSGRIHQVRRGLYMLVPPYQTVKPHPFLLANALMPGSYVSMQSALAFYGLIPEYTPRILSMTLRRPSHWEGGFHFQHLAPHFFFGYQLVELPQGQQAFLATPEKGLLDLVHLTPGSDSSDYLEQLRLQNLDRLDLTRLHEYVKQSGKPKWQRAAELIETLAQHESAEFEELP
jgi:predicted transcriptional regulator of viral defense system